MIALIIGVYFLIGICLVSYMFHSDLRTRADFKESPFEVIMLCVVAVVAWPAFLLFLLLHE